MRPERSYLSSGAGTRVDRPAIPVKPSHLSPIVANSSKRAVSDLRPKLNSVTNKVNNSSPKPHIAEAKNTIINGSSGKTGNPLPTKPSTGKKSELSEVDNVRLNLHPVINNNNKIHTESVASKQPQRVADDGSGSEAEEEEGIKRISADSIQNIRRDANVMSFQFAGKSAPSPGSGLSHLPGGTAHLPGGSAVYSSDDSKRQSDMNKKVGLIFILINPIRIFFIYISPPFTYLLYVGTLFFF